MELSGTLAENLTAAITSARRLREHHVHADTLAYWHELLDFARARRGQVGQPVVAVEGLIADLEGELAAR